jgi:DNA-binding transcriptional LysR family regulator
MDIELARTFLAVVAAGSFLGAAEELHLTQTAISARIRVLEDQLGRRLFIRNKAGARLTDAGERFRRDAMSLLQIWERARQRVALPPGHANVVSIGGELSLWSPLLTDWLVWMRQQHSELALRAEVNTPAHLLDKVQNGSIDLAVLYSPPPRSDLTVELLTEEKLIMVSTSETSLPSPAGYVHVDWGEAFATSIQAAFPNLINPGVSVSLGPLALSYLLAMGGSGYFRRSVVQRHLANGRMRLVDGAPEFSYSVHAVYSARGEADLVDQARAGLKACISSGQS